MIRSRYRIQWIPGLVFLGFLQAQPNPGDQVLDRIKIATFRIQVEERSNPILYLDQPESGYRMHVVSACDSVLDRAAVLPIKEGELEQDIGHLLADIQRVRLGEVPFQIPVKERKYYRKNYFFSSRP